jgi:CheB methylesterase
VGLEGIKAQGGITFAQDDSAKYDSMPRSAVAAGCVDFVLSPEYIAKELARIAQHPYVAGPPLEAPRLKTTGLSLPRTRTMKVRCRAGRFGEMRQATRLRIRAGLSSDHCFGRFS